MNLHDLAERVGDLRSLDSPAQAIADMVHRRIPPRSTVKDLLSGTWLGHPLHPMLTDIPIGSFTSASVLDVIGGQRAARAADRLVALGLISSVATAAAGAADWSDTIGPERRIGLVHAGANVVGVGLYGASALARRRGRRGAGAALGLAGMSVMTVGGYLGGHLSYSRGTGVDHTANRHRIDEWTDIVALEEVEDGGTTSVEVQGTPVLLHRRGTDLMALAGNCSHAGGPLGEGEVDEERCTVTCPWHQSVFRLDSGEVVHGPATSPQPTYDVRVADGRVQVRERG